MRQNEKKPFVIGLTGGIGSGKSRLASHAVRSFRVRRILADEVGRELMEPGKSVYRALVGEFGSAILTKDGRIDKKKLSEICFRDANGQKKLNEIEHPLIRTEILNRIQRTKLPAVILEAALLDEGRLTGDCDEVIYVHADRQVRISRLMKTRGYGADRCERIMALQAGEAGFRAVSSVEIDNSGSFREAAAALDGILKQWGVPKR